MLLTVSWVTFSCAPKPEYIPQRLGHERILVHGPLSALRATFSGDAPGIPRFAPVRGAAPHARTYSRASVLPASSRTSSGPSGHLPRARGRLRALSRSQITEKYEPRAFSPQGEGGPRSGGRGPWTCGIRTKQMMSPVWRRTPQGEAGPQSGGRGPLSISSKT